MTVLFAEGAGVSETSTQIKTRHCGRIIGANNRGLTPILFLLMLSQRYFYAALMFSVFAAFSNMAGAQQGCATNSYGQVICAPPGGGAAVNSYSQVVTGRGGCAKNSYGQVVCADNSGGGATTNSYGQVQTGPGQCVTNSYGQVMCSSQPGGGAAINSYGQAVCAGGCVPGR